MIIQENRGSVNELKTKLKTKYPALTNKDLLITDNNVESMLTMVAYKLRKSKEELGIIIEDL